MLLKDSTIICMRNIFKILKRAKTYEAEVAKCIVKSISCAGFVLEYFYDCFFVLCHKSADKEKFYTGPPKLHVSVFFHLAFVLMQRRVRILKLFLKRFISN